MSEAELEKLRHKVMLLYHFTLNYCKNKTCFILTSDLSCFKGWGFFVFWLVQLTLLRKGSFCPFSMNDVDDHHKSLSCVLKAVTDYFQRQG